MKIIRKKKEKTIRRKEKPPENQRVYKD